MGRNARSRKPSTNGQNKIQKTKRMTRMIDQIWDETRPEKIDKSTSNLTQFDEEKPGLGKYYCIACARYFQNEDVLKEHFKTKKHKKRNKELKEKPYSTEEALGMAIDNGKEKSSLLKTTE